MARYIFFFITLYLVNAYNNERLLKLQLEENQAIKQTLNYHENFTERCRKYEYPSQAYPVTTEDGYILTLFRLTKRPHCVKLKSPPVLLQHGLFTNAISWLDPGPKAGIPYLLADNCFDVWCGNARGTEFSRNHTKLNPDRDPKFWQFSFHEIGLYDLPAMIDFILATSDSTSLNYIGHSQGCNEIFALGSTKPVYMEKLNTIIALAPGMNLKNSKNFLLNIWNSLPTYSVLDTIGIQEVLHRHSLIQEFLYFLCHSKSNARLCAALLFQVDGFHEDSITHDTLSLMFTHAPDGVSLKNIDHLSQITESGEFRLYDYKEDNLKMYGKNVPPFYDLKKVKVPVQIIYGENDFLVNATDVREFSKQVRNLRAIYKVEDLLWNHLDFIWSSLIPKYLYPKIKKCLEDSG